MLNCNTIGYVHVHFDGKCDCDTQPVTITVSNADAFFYIDGSAGGHADARRSGAHGDRREVDLPRHHSTPQHGRDGA